MHPKGWLDTLRRGEIALAAAQAVWSLHNRIYDPWALWGLGRTVDVCEAEI
jgi:hypothetical protein